MNPKYIVLVMCVVIAAAGAFGGCDQSTIVQGTSNDTIPTIRQGIYGYVEFWEGDFMPTYPSGSGGSITPVERTIEIHTPTRFDDTHQVDYSGFYAWVSTPLIAKTKSNSRGFFQAELPAGTYSIFIVENSFLYASGGDGQGYLWPVTVQIDSLSFVKLKITYKATF